MPGIRRAEGVGGNVTALTITSGEKVTGSSEQWGVPRKDLLASVEVLIEAGRLEIARKLKEAERLVKELQAMRANGKGGEHDDLVFALALACWRARFGEAGFRDKPLLDFGVAPEGFARVGEDWDPKRFQGNWG